MIQTQGLSFSYTSAKMSFPDIHCKPGNTLLITGASGKGKTTLLHLLAGLLKPATGRIFIKDSDIVLLGERAMDRFRGNNIGLVFQRNHFIASLSALDNLLLTSFLSGNRSDRKHAFQLLERLNIADQAYKNPSALSVGQQQRLSIARSLINRPAVLLADEPTSSLDDENCSSVAQLLQEQASQAGAALLIVTHDHRLKDFFSHQITLT